MKFCLSKLVLSFLLYAFVVAAEQQEDSNLILRASEEGISLAKKIAFSIINETLPVVLSPIRRSFGPEFLNSSVEFNPLTLVSIDYKEDNLRFNITDDEISMKIKNLTLKLNTTMRTSFAALDHEANYNITAKGISFEIFFNLSLTNTSSPKITIKKSSVSLKKLLLDFEGDMLNRVMGGMLKYAVSLVNNYFQSYMIIALENTLNRDLNSFLSTFPKEIEIGQLESKFNITMVMAPILREKSISLWSKGTFKSKDSLNNENTTNYGKGINETSNDLWSQHHGSAILGAPLFNSLFDVIHEKQFLNFKINHTSVKPNALLFFDTRGFQTFFPNMMRTYSRLPVDLRCSTGGVPVLTLLEGQAQLKAILKCAVLVVSNETGRINSTMYKHHGDLILHLRGNFSLYLDEEKSARLKLNNIELDEVFTSVNGVTTKPLIFLFLLKFRAGKMVMMGEITSFIEKNKIKVLPDKVDQLIKAINVKYTKDYISIDFDFNSLEKLKKSSKNSK